MTENARSAGQDGSGSGAEAHSPGRAQDRGPAQSSGQGAFIAFEGGEGAGKSTQVRALADALRARGIAVVTTREPGGTPGGEDIRKLLVEGETDRWAGLTEALLNYAARAEHLDRLIRPALSRGEWVLTDRFADSTDAYQGAGRGVPPGALGQLRAMVVAETEPDLTILLDIPPEDGLSRARARPDADTRFEAEDLSFHEALRTRFQRLAHADPERYAVIDARAEEQAVADAVRQAVEERFGARVEAAGERDGQG
jgi:dTMP kinase